MRTYIIDGNNFSDIEGFYCENTLQTGFALALPEHLYLSLPQAAL